MSVELTQHAELEVGSSRSFGLVFATVFLLVSAYPLLVGGSLRIWALIVSAVFALLALLLPKVLEPLNLLWFKFGLLLGRIVNPIVMFLIYVIAIVPTGIALKLFGKDLLRLKSDPVADSYWISRAPPGPEPDSLKDQF